MKMNLGNNKENYELKTGLDLPVITVKVIKLKTRTKGLFKKKKRKAGKSVSIRIKVTPSYKRTVYLQQYVKGIEHSL